MQSGPNDAFLSLRQHTTFVHACVQEQSLKLFKRTYVLGDPQKLEDFDTAMQALKNVCP